MGWDRHPSATVEAPSAISPIRWVGSLAVVALVCASLFLLHASQRLPLLESLNIWWFSLSPMLILGITFAVRAFRYGGALERYQFLEDEAQAAQVSWENWAGRYLTVHDGCVLLPNQVSAAVLAAGVEGLSLQAGAAHPLPMLPTDPFERMQGSLLLLVEALQPSLESLPVASQLHVTLLSDLGPEQNLVVAEAWQRVWKRVLGKQPEPAFEQVDALSFSWVDEKIKSCNERIELVVVVQLNGRGAYSEALAALLLGLDCSAVPETLPTKARLLRPMPVDISDMQNESAGLMQSQKESRSATGLVADVAEWQPLCGALFAQSRVQGGALRPANQWVQENYSGLTGPFGHWVVTALGAEMVQHRQEPLLILGKEASRHWVTTIATEENA